MTDEPEGANGEEPDADFLREMIGYCTQGLIELEVGGLTGSAHAETRRGVKPGAQNADTNDGATLFRFDAATPFRDDETSLGRGSETSSKGVITPLREVPMAWNRRRKEAPESLILWAL